MGIEDEISRLEMERRLRAAGVQIEMGRRGAAAMAHATAGRSRVVPDKRKYDRKRDKRRGAQEGLS